VSGLGRGKEVSSPLHQLRCCSRKKATCSSRHLPVFLGASRRHEVEHHDKAVLVPGKECSNRAVSAINGRQGQRGVTVQRPTPRSSMVMGPRDTPKFLDLTVELWESAFDVSPGAIAY